MSETTRRAGRPRALTPAKRRRLLDALTGGMSLAQSARYLFIDRSSIHRELTRDDDLRAAVDDAREAGKEARAMAITVDDPEARIAQLQRDRALAAYDASVGVAGAESKLRAVESALAEARAAVERARLVEEGKQRREQERIAREHDAERKRLADLIKRLESEQKSAFKEIESVMDTTIAAIRHGVDVAEQLASTIYELQRFEGDENASNAAAFAQGEVANRILHRLSREARLRDVRCYPELGSTPLA